MTDRRMKERMKQAKQSRERQFKWVGLVLVLLCLPIWIVAVSIVFKVLAAVVACS